jgi:hypothetical protein
MTKMLWLITTLILALLPITSYLILIFWVFSASMDKLVIIYLTIVYLLMHILPTCIIIRCAYQKPGTAYLTFTLLLSPFVVLFHLTKSIEGITTLAQAQSPPMLLFLCSLFIFLNVALYLVWYWLCLRLRSINLSLQSESAYAIAKSSDETQHSLT